jgi:hypothetical protein
MRGTMAESQATATAPIPQSEPVHTPIQFQFLEERQPRRRFLKLLSKHQLLPAFIGAAVVFGTFIVKETLREHLKDFAESLDRSETLFTLRRDHSFLQSELSLVHQSLRESKYTRIGASKLEEYNQKRGELFGVMSVFSETLDNCLELVQQLPAKRGESYIKELDRIQLLFDNLDKARYNIMPDVRDSTFVDPEWFKLRNAILNEMTISVMYDKNDVDRIALKIFADAREVRHENEHWYQVCTWVSYFLYTLGWGLGLVGRLVGVGGVGED